MTTTRRTTTMDKDGAIVGGWGATRTSRWATWQRHRPCRPPGTATGRGRGWRGSTPMIFSLTKMAQTMEMTRKATTATAKTAAAEVTETTRTHT